MPDRLRFSPSSLQAPLSRRLSRLKKADNRLLGTGKSRDLPRKKGIQELLANAVFGQMDIFADCAQDRKEVVLPKMLPDELQGIELLRSKLPHPRPFSQDPRDPLVPVVKVHEISGIVDWYFFRLVFHIVLDGHRHLPRNSVY